MPAQKDLKRLIRGRMQKTGESYTAARTQLLKHTRPPRATAPAGYAALAGQTDAVVRKNTGRDWSEWVALLDRAGAHAWPHRDIARHLRAEYAIPGWWSQSVTVGYERIKGLRAVGQRRDGWFEANKSRTVLAPLTRVYSAFSDRRKRARWLPGVDVAIRSATRGKAMRLAWPDGTSVIVGFERKAPGKSVVAIQHGKLADRAAATRMKAFWAERLDALRDLLAEARR